MTSITLENEALNNIDAPSFSSRVMLLLKQQDRTQSWLADQIGISKQALGYILSSGKKPKLINEIAEALSVNPNWLITGDLPMVLCEKEVNQIPIFDLNEIANVDLSTRQHHKNYILSNHAPEQNCFAITFNHSSMEPTFKSGSILIFDSTKAARSGNYILFMLEETKDVMFREYIKEGSDLYLKACNEMFKVIINQKITIYGVLIESRYIL